VSNSLLVVLVDVAVSSEHLNAFLTATFVNARASRAELGVLRFDVLSDRAESGHVLLMEVYRDEAAAVAHKATPHYATWRDTVEPLMVRPRRSTRFVNASPDDRGW
jgi:autoinducer 2-degrading protein